MTLCFGCTRDFSVDKFLEAAILRNESYLQNNIHHLRHNL